MVYSESLATTKAKPVARTGDFRTIARWLNQALMPYGIRALVGSDRAGRLRVLLELYPSAENFELVEHWRDPLMRYICHQLWLIRSPRIETLRLRARFAGDRQILWDRQVRLRRSMQQPATQSTNLRRRIQRTSRERSHLKLVRTIMVSGSTAAAFLVGGVFGSVKSPVENSNALTAGNQQGDRPVEVKAAAETVAVRQHTDISNSSDPDVTMMFSGDVTLAEHYERRFSNDPEWAFAKLDAYREADIAMVNLENPLTRATLNQPNKRFTFKADPKLVEVLKAGGVDIVTLANNHSMDFKEAGLTETLNVLDSAGIMRIGAGRDLNEARRPKVVDVKGQRIAFLGYYGEEYAATSTKAGTNSVDEQRIAEDIQAIRNEVDWIIVNYHWGQEKASQPAEWQRKLARFTIDQGADVVVGHHPHVLQGAEIYKGRPIAYSLGNFIFGGNSRDNYDTAVLKVAVNDRQMKVEFVPIQVRDYQARVAAAADGEAILKRLTGLSARFEQPMPVSTVLERQVSNAAPTQLVQPQTPESTPAPEPTTPNSSEQPTVTPSPTPESQSEQAPEAAPSQSPETENAQPGGDGFITSPNHTPFNKSNPDTWQLPKPEEKPKWRLQLPFTQPKDDTTESMQTPSQEPQTPADKAPASEPAAEPINAPAPDGETETPPQNSHIELTHRPDASEPEKSDLDQTSTSQPMQSDRTRHTSPEQWKQPGKVGADLVPDVSLQGAPQW
ncbi:MAG TPA: CapA family protein [Leptolyngbyaceae cyanobacterium M33_DOE_097]|uniref:CapA family protein n=1 Tax=Oscillatoriales cyanobacterium SpSt-418 TaxID=2282169 RepID=A0A7C3PAZ3_9CYAN|nr:CapA family protein [Leptolyngbyaceae cyanobacterium M33_DOE_097]